ncbi:MAG: 2-dehydro-3-deoxy-D-gluconate 5-dehydrogenase KduD [Rectinemataceae bacterium]
MAGILDRFTLNGKVAVVTGADKGLGRAIAIALAQAGADVFGSSRSPDAPVTAKAVAAAGRRYAHIAADLSDTSRAAGIVDAAVVAFGRVDILVNNAGTILRNDAVDFTEADWDTVMDVNLKSAFFLCQAAAKRFMAQGGGGKIVNIASLLSFQGGIRIPSYTAAKSGLRGLTMLLSNEWAKFGINVNAVAPGYMVTDNTEALRADPGRSAEILGRIPAGRWGKPEDVAGAVLFLASPAAEYVNGFTVAVDGGWLGR